MRIRAKETSTDAEDRAVKEKGTMNTNTRKTSLIKTLMVGGASGIAIGCMIELLFSYLSAQGAYAPGAPSFLERFSDVHQAVLIERGLYALIGVVSMLAARVYANEQRSLLLSTVLHVGAVGVMVMAAGLILGWFKSRADVLAAFAIFVVVYAVIWLRFYFYERRIARQFNEQLSRMSVGEQE